MHFDDTPTTRTIPARQGKHCTARATVPAASPPKQRRLKLFFHEECWCDAAVYPNGPSAGAACFYRKPGSLRPPHVTTRQCGHDTCSYRGEILTIEHALEDLLDRLLPSGPQAVPLPRADSLSSTDTLELLKAVSTAAPAPRGTQPVKTYRGRHYLVATDSQSAIRALE